VASPPIQESAANVESEPETLISPQQLKFLRGYLGYSQNVDKYVAWGLEFFGAKDVAAYIHERHGVDIGNNMNRHSASGFSACCGYGEIIVGNLGKGEPEDWWKKRMLDAWISRKTGVIASIAKNTQYIYLEPLQKLGFKVVAPWAKNPNSGNFITMLYFQFPFQEE
jgi:hypothetical protein